MSPEQSKPGLQKLKFARAVTYALYALLIVGFSAWQLTRPEGPLYTFWVIQLLPLLILAPGMWAGWPRAYIWLCFVLLPYFVKGVDGVFSPSRAWIDYLVPTASFVLFISSMLTSRWLQMARKNPHR